MARTIELGPLYQAIEELQDDALILKLYELLGIAPKQELYQLSEEQLLALEAAEAEIERGEGIDHEVVMAEARKWLRA